MFTTPLRSEKMPPSAANVSGVAARSVAAISADQTKTLSSALHARARREQPEEDADDGNRYRAATDSPPRALS